MARPTLEINENDALGLAPARAAAAAASAAWACKRNSEPSVRPNMPAPPTRSTVPPRDPQFSIAKILAGLSGYDEHDCTSLMVEQERGTVDQGPGQVLGERETRLFQLLGAELDVATQPFELGIRGQRATGFRQARREVGPARDRRATAGSPRPGPRCAASIPGRGCGSVRAARPSACRSVCPRPRPECRRCSPAAASTATGRGALVTEMRKRPRVCWPSGKSWTMRIMNIPGPATLSCVSKTAVCDWPVLRHDGPAFVGRLANAVCTL